MKPLFFHATSEIQHPKVLGAIEGQTYGALRPFRRFLQQAIHAARQRQTRYQLRWERVQNLRTFRLQAVGSLVRVPRRAPGVLLTDWPAGNKPDLTQQGFVPARGLPVRFEAATWTTDGLLVRTKPPLEPGDSVIWCMVQSDVRREEAPLPPREVTDATGRPLKVIAGPREDGERWWRLALEESIKDGDLIVVDGEDVDAEVLSAFEDLRRVTDSANHVMDVEGESFRREDEPAKGVLEGDNLARLRWSETGSEGRRGCWVQLLPMESSADVDEFLDPRAAFCEGEVHEVWTQARHSAASTIKVKKVDQDRYQLLLDRYPPEGSTLFLPIDQRSLYLQQRALRQLCDAPLPHHRGLLRLCEDPERVNWPEVRSVSIGEAGWRSLTDASRSGTDEQRAFVQKALGTQDFAFLEGPPGSGKTTAICEIVQQLIAQGQRVLLCASTHVAIDNVLERLINSDSPIDAVRIGKLDRVDEVVQATQLDERVSTLVKVWRALPSMRGTGDAELEAMAERTVIMAANLTCGTTMGIVHHPLLAKLDLDIHAAERPITAMPHWDVLIVDEASKTLIQEFLVPAMLARRWIIVGDVRQLPPFADRADIVANLRDLVDERERPIFGRDHQRACLLLARLLRREARQRGARWLLVEPPGVLDWIARELAARPEPGLTVVRVTSRTPAPGGVETVTADDVRAGSPDALRLAAADWVLVEEGLITDMADRLPSTLVLAEELTGTGGPLSSTSAFLFRQAHWLQRFARLERPYTEKKSSRDEVTTVEGMQGCERDWLQRNDLAQEIAWRITRIHELRHSRNERERARLDRQLFGDEERSDRASLRGLLPYAVSIDESIEEIEDIGLPSILEVLQEGIGEDRAKRRSSLTQGFRATRPRDFEARFTSLSYQHRMHPDIAAFSRELIYEGEALRDANTIQLRDARLGWDFRPSWPRRVWAHREGREERGINHAEVQAMKDILREFFEWAKRKGAPARDLPKIWEVACLCFYAKQEGAIAAMLRELTGDDRKTRFRAPSAPVEIVCGTVDRFQGREADLVLVSMRNTRRVGFLDSPNRLNVGMTRARQQLVVVGNAEYFGECGVSELEELATRTPRTEPREDRGRRVAR